MIFPWELEPFLWLGLWSLALILPIRLWQARAEGEIMQDPKGEKGRPLSTGWG